jgi:hypothetical protein
MATWPYFEAEGWSLGSADPALPGGDRPRLHECADLSQSFIAAHPAAWDENIGE